MVHHYYLYNNYTIIYRPLTPRKSKLSALTVSASALSDDDAAPVQRQLQHAGTPRLPHAREPRRRAIHDELST